MHRHVRQHELQPLEFGDGLAELPALLGIFHRGIQRALRQTHRDRADGRTVHIENAHRYLEAVAFLADAVLDGYLDVLQVDRCVRNSVQPKLSLVLANGDAGRFGIDNEGAEITGAAADIADAGKRLGIAVLFCSHEVNPLLRAVDRVLYLGNGNAAVGSVDEVISGPVLSKLYGTHINVVRVAGRIFVMADDVELESGAHVHDL